ncbi:hypothetical protein [uncultured Enterovirga sp.]|uniref:hypothetical protein n=1 Tax=uncultured Enterovirga sp. TaxID=2026352 RepID=UPI0035C9EB64
MGGLSVTGCLVEFSARLTDAATIAKAAVVCAESGSEKEAVRLSMDLDKLLHEAETLHRAVAQTNRSERSAPA